MDKQDIAAILDEIGTILDLLGENPFKVRAHKNAARVIETLDADIAELAASGELINIKGIGKQIAAKIESLVSTGELPELAELREKIPDGVLDMLSISGLGPKKVKALWAKLGVTTIGELEYACEENRLIELDGFGAKSQEKILKGIESLKKFSNLYLLPAAMELAETALEHLVKEKSVKRAQIAGSARRAKEVLKDVDIVASSSKPEKVMDHFVKTPGVIETISKGGTKSSVRLESGIQVDLRVVSDKEYPYALHHFTGSKEHNTKMRSIAKGKGIKMNEYGLFKGEKLIPCKDEEEVFGALGLAFIPPERRENIGEIEEAGKKSQKRLIELGDIRGIFHVHTTYSDGKESVETMAKECRKRGWEYLGISDHSRSAGYAGGLSIERLKKQGDEIDKINDKLKDFKIFKGIESDILMDGKLDYPDRELKRLDFVVASVHSGFNLDEKKMTERIIAAIKNPYTTMLGHPTGRLLLARDGYRVNMDKVIEACAKHDVIIELNANPHRLDIDWRHIGAALNAGVKISVNPDAHRIPGLDHLAFGVLTARKGGCGAGDVFNTGGVSEIEAELAELKK